MLDASLQRILDSLGPDDVLLDIGAWGRPLTRADWIMDLMPYETRGDYGYDGPQPERFSADTWVQRDICDREPYPFEDKSIDFVICSHTLEDIRDPIWVCDEMTRIAKAGYIEVPSRLEEQSYGFQGPWAGWGHHRWLIEKHGNRLDFVFKHHVLHNRDSDRFPPGFQQTLTPEERVVQLWWEDDFEYGERVFIGKDEVDPYLSDFVTAHRPPPPPAWRRVGGKVKRRLRSALAGPSGSR